MKNKKLLLIAMLFLSLSSYAQIDWAELEKNRQLENEQNQFDLNNVNAPLSSNDPITTTAEQILADLDMDGMDDDWELDNNLDPNNPQDAFGDEDNDKIINLFEFQLETDPNSDTSPSIIEFTPAGNIDDLKEVVEAAEGSIRVVRMAQGDYSAIGNVIFYDGYRLMLQGGWNDDFSDYDPDQYVTNWVGPTSEAMVLLWLGIDTNDSSTTILDGIQFSAQDYFSLYGVVQVTNNQGHANVSLKDCSFANSEFYGFGITSRNIGTTSNFLVMNTTFGNNLSGGIYTQITSSAISDWRLINMTNNNPGSSDGGIDGLTNSSGDLNVSIINSIIWGNTAPSLNFSAISDADFDLSHSNIDPPSGTTTVVSQLNTIDTDPLFVDAPASDWTLQETSPCVDTGIDVGIQFFDAAPEMGAFERGGCAISTVQLDIFACDSYSYEGDVLDASGTYEYAFINAAGCDSLVTLNLAIETLAPEITSDGMTLTASPTGATYQWLDCASNDPPIAGATGPTFTPTVSGTYAVEITDGVCTKTSECLAIVVTSLENTLFESLSYAPNPVNDLLHIDFGETQEELSMKLTDVTGKQIKEWEFYNISSTSVEIFDLAKGVYFLNIQSGSKQQSVKLIKK